MRTQGPWPGRRGRLEIGTRPKSRTPRRSEASEFPVPEKGSARADGVGPPFPCVSVQRRRNAVVRILAAPGHVSDWCSLRPILLPRIRVWRPEDPVIGELVAFKANLSTPWDDPGSVSGPNWRKMAGQDRHLPSARGHPWSQDHSRNRHPGHSERWNRGPAPSRWRPRSTPGHRPPGIP